MIFLFLESLRSDARSILKTMYPQGMVEYWVSGSSMQYINNTKQRTKPEYAFDQVEKKYDWCTNIGKSNTDFPWIILSIKNHKMKLSGYTLRSGCCQSGCCCETEKYCIECYLFSWSFQISDDNETWVEIHKGDKEYEMTRCKEKTFMLNYPQTAKYVRIIQTGTCYGDPPCFALNKVELIGDLERHETPEEKLVEPDDEDISIIGYISRNKI